MAVRGQDITSVIRRQIQEFGGEVTMVDVGTVVEVGDGIARIQGLSGARYTEMVEFPGDVMGIAMNLEEVALRDEYFVERKLYPNVDFYSGIIYRAMGLPTDMFTVMFAIARTVGWVSHWREMVRDPESRIGRPRQLYVGPEQRDYVALGER